MVDREALLARRATRRRASRAATARPLEGVPLGVKDLEDCAGLITSHGSIPYKDNLATHDSVQVARLRGAGAIPIGKTNAPEFGYTAITKNLIFGVTRNPWNLELTPGGSSGGSSAALSACMLPLVTASDGGGSTRIPACFVGAFGLKPTLRAHSERAEESLVLRRHGGARSAHQDRRRQRAVSRRDRRLRARRPELAAAPGLLVPDEARRRACRASCASPTRRTSATRSCSPTSRRRSTTRRACSRSSATRWSRSKAARRRWARPGACGAPSRWRPRTCTTCPRARRTSAARVLASMKLAWEMTPEWFREQAHARGSSCRAGASRCSRTTTS